MYGQVIFCPQPRAELMRRLSMLADEVAHRIGHRLGKQSDTLLHTPQLDLGQTLQLSRREHWRGHGALRLLARCIGQLSF